MKLIIPPDAVEYLSQRTGIDREEAQELLEILTGMIVLATLNHYDKLTYKTDNAS